MKNEIERFTVQQMLRTFKGRGTIMKPRFYLNKDVGLLLTINKIPGFYTVVQHNVSNEKYFGAEVIAQKKHFRDAKIVFNTQIKMVDILYG